MRPSTSSARKPCVLVADDVPANVVIVSSALEDEFTVVQASTGPAVLERVAAGDVDLVLLDVVMPGLDGFDVCRRLKENPATAHVPVIFVTMLEETVEEAHGFEVGAVDYITKPIRPAIVRARVRTHVELKRTRDMLEQLASVDSLTGVANRRRFDVALDEEWRRCQRGQSWLSLAIVDVDHFKQFNDRYGHLAGDARLRRIAASFAAFTRRAGDLVARYGGEEFALILPNVDGATMPVVAGHLLRGATEAGANPALPSHEPMTVSIGAVSVVPARDATARDAFAAADDLLYAAKKEGRDRAIHLDLTTKKRLVVTRQSTRD
jgi:diguanylate cyclase (GGDEF)-like protein